MAAVSRLLPFTSSPYNVHVPAAPAPTGTSVSSMSMSHSTGGKGTVPAVSTPITVQKVGAVKHPLTSSSGLPSTDVRKKVRMTGMSPSDDAVEEGEDSGEEDDKDSDYIAVTDAAIGNVVEGGGNWGDGSNH